MKLTLEQTFIAEATISGNKIPELRTILPDGSCFINKECGDFWESILDTYDNNGSVDLALLTEHSKERGLDDLHIFEWTTCVNYSSEITTHAGKIAEIYMKRMGEKSLVQLATDFRDNPDPFEAIESSISTLSALVGQFRKEHAVSMSTVAGEAHQELDNIRKGVHSSIPFGFFDLDFTTGGMERGDLIIIAALEKHGKTTLMLQTMFHNAERGIPGIIFSAEMKRKQLLFRYALIKESIPWINVKRNNLSEEDWARLSRRINLIGSLPLYVRDGVLTVSDIFSDAERFITERGVKIAAIDYIQKIVPVSKKSTDNREREIASISSGLKNIAMKFDVPVIGLSQLNKEMRARESMSVEQDMDKMITIDSEDHHEISSSGKIVGVKIRQRMGLSGGFGDTKLLYDTINGSWKNYTNTPESIIQQDAF